MAAFGWRTKKQTITFLKKNYFSLEYFSPFYNSYASYSEDEIDRLCTQSLQSLQSCLTFCDPMDCSPPTSLVHGSLWARILECLPCPPPGCLPDRGIKPISPVLQADSLQSEPLGKPGKWFIYISFQSLFHYRLLQDIEYSSLYYTVGPCWLQ